jgi:hypothetical protein
MPARIELRPLDEHGALAIARRPDLELERRRPGHVHLGAQSQSRTGHELVNAPEVDWITEADGEGTSTAKRFPNAWQLTFLRGLCVLCVKKVLALAPQRLTEFV